ncbi:nitrate reductase molybdenum cofactor assembly chaperone [Mycolicibacterium conceptionense]|uniref:Nitrate reductase molybdenum cofactor assembly chaperone n=2 Tax=Mycobacteriaceae TaxID=1762 RepID=A0A1A1Z5Q0_9MYCO|nr:MULTISPECIES: nitrate reductase molybdenum cofactor assembly chaperone [Mycolicibacterium]MCW1822483.1 nitrate reductase molybdenum cofactor assembly chaperone [Mycolicibacterium senegalense]OBB05962.1 nitrate reductase molybdenum cofactor assembly chaperone [Mycolicibacterium conceptionense]OBE93441.1 nitrate reductase molybdenum cofactor assembly chaperone [Mycolicibacterium conceptionense]OBF25297.1 nitrate reductase molybdenum cofactor assembly chaperone [Mycolicibacterium conceptionense
MRRRRNRENAMQDRLVWQAASLLLSYPDDGHADRLQTAARLLDHVTGEPRALLDETVAGLSLRPAMELAQEYVETFDLQKRCTMLLTYWTSGDTRNRGADMVEFTQTYRAAGVEIPKGEAPDHLPVVLEFAATVDPAAGRRLLAKYRVPIGVVAEALAERKSPYAPAVAAVDATLPPLAFLDDVSRLMVSGPPAESVGLQPFQLTVPPRRA